MPDSETIAALKGADYKPGTITEDALQRLKLSLSTLGGDRFRHLFRNVLSHRLVGGHQRVKSLNSGCMVILDQQFDEA